MTHTPEPREWKDARTHREPIWPFFGFAPDNYMGKCLDCGVQCSGMDKRAIRCFPCATDFASTAAYVSREATKKIEAENAILRSAIQILGSKDAEKPGEAA